MTETHESTIRVKQQAGLEQERTRLNKGMKERHLSHDKNYKSAAESYQS